MMTSIMWRRGETRLTSGLQAPPRCGRWHDACELESALIVSACCRHETFSNVPFSIRGVHPQVLPDNAYERRRSDPEADAAEPSGAENMDFGQSGEPPIRQSSPPAQRGPSSGSGSNGRKRVRFTAYVPPQRRSTDGSEPAQVHTWQQACTYHIGHLGLSVTGCCVVPTGSASGLALNMWHCAIDAQSGGGLKSSLKQRPGRPASRTGRQSTSTVPEHMQHPERFTVYELEEPLIVGGGDRSANPAPERSQVRFCLQHSETASYLLS